MRVFAPVGFTVSTDAVPAHLAVYCSSHSSTQITATRFFTGCGAGVGSKTPNNVGLVRGDIIISVESSGGASPGRTTLHSVVGSTWNQASTSASTAFNSSAGYNCTVSAAAT